MLLANFKQKRTAAASRGLLAIARTFCLIIHCSNCKKEGADVSAAHLAGEANIRSEAAVNKKGQLSLTNPRDACEKFARFM